MMKHKNSLRVFRGKLARRTRVRNLLLASIILFALVLAGAFIFILSKQDARAGMLGGDLTFLEVSAGNSHNCAVASDTRRIVGGLVPVAS